MTPADFTIEFYRKCLSQAKWESDDERDVASVALLIKVANERGGPFLDSYIGALDANHLDPAPFPVADKTATENPQQKTNTKPNTPMKAMLTEIYEALIKPLIDAIDRNTAAKGGCAPSYVITTDAPAEVAEDKPAEPKKRKSKTAETPAPEPKVDSEPEPTPVVEEPYLSGTELVELMKPLSGTKYTKILVEFRNETLGFEKMTREMSDPTMLRQMEVKVRECLAANEEDQKEV